MGLDMYLDKRKYIWTNDRDKLKISGVDGVKSKKVKYITEEVMYWRKANAIHKWFVDNVQEGNDDCKEYYVTIEDLEKLLGVIETILKSKARCVIAEELLPNESGFFFGSTEYDEYYFEDLKETVKGLKTIIKDNTNSGWEFYYNSSW